MVHNHTLIFFHLRKPIHIKMFEQKPRKKTHDLIFTNDFCSDELYIWKNDSHLNNYRESKL